MTAATSATPPQPAPPIGASLRRPSGEAIGAQPCKRSRSSRCTEPIGSRPEGLLMAHSKQSKNTSMDAFLVPMDTEPEATQRRKRKQRPSEEEPADGEDDADNKEQEEPETENSDAESEREGTEESEDDHVLPAAMMGREAADSVASIKETKQMSTATEYR